MCAYEYVYVCVKMAGTVFFYCVIHVQLFIYSCSQP